MDYPFLPIIQKKSLNKDILKADPTLAEKDPNTNAIASNKYLIFILFLPE